GEVGFGRVHGHERHGLARLVAIGPQTGEVEDAVALPGHVARAEAGGEVEVADVLGVVVAGDDDGGEVGVEERRQVVLGVAELVGVAVGGEVAADEHEVGGEGPDLLDGMAQELRVEERRPAVDVGELGDQEGVPGHGPAYPTGLWNCSTGCSKSSSARRCAGVWAGGSGGWRASR